MIALLPILHCCWTATGSDLWEHKPKISMTCVYYRIMTYALFTDLPKFPILEIDVNIQRH